MPANWSADVMRLENIEDEAIPAPESPATVPLDTKHANLPTVWKFTILGAPMGKPRMTQRDKWKKRPCVVRYREWADKARESAPSDLTKTPLCVSWVAYFPIPKSWTLYQKTTRKGRLHSAKPDRDNVDKGILDALWKDDSHVAYGVLEKRWDDGNGPRIELTVTESQGQ